MVKRKLATAISSIAVAACMMMSSIPAQASANYTPIAGTSTTFNKFLVMSAGDKAPNATFEYTVAAGAAVSSDTSDNSVFEVTPGVTPENVTVTPTTFAPDNATYNSAQTGHIDINRQAADRATGLTSNTGVEFETSKGEKYAVQQATVSFANVNFTEPGVYRYIISETASTAHENAGIMHDNDTDRVLDVYVTDDGNGALVVSSYVMHTDVSQPAINADMGTADVQAAAAALQDKSDGFTNEYKTYDLAFRKDVTGNQASRDKVFDMTLSLTGLTAGDKYVVSLADDNDANTLDGNADATSATNVATRSSNAGQTNVTELTADENGEVTQHFFLSHGQSIAVRGLPKNATYTVTEDKEDYKSTAATTTEWDDATTGVIGTIATTAPKYGSTNRIVKTSYLNTRSGIIPTGATMAVGAMALVLGFGGAGFAALTVRKKEDDDEE